MADTIDADVERLAQLAYEADITSHFDRLGTPTRARPPVSWESETEHCRDGYRAIVRAVRDAIRADPESEWAQGHRKGRATAHATRDVVSDSARRPRT